MSQMMWPIIAVVIVLALIGATAWLVRRFAGNSVGASGARGRMPRLAVVDAAAVDGRRRLVLVRRDNVEHLIMIGGPTDVVVEPNIVRGAAQRDSAPQRAPAGTELPARIAPLPDANNWADNNDAGRPEIFDFPEPVAVPERAARASHFEDTRRPPPSINERGRGDEFSGLVPEPISREPVRAERPAPRSERAEPRVPRAEIQPRAPAAPSRAPARSVEPPTSAADQNLAEMAQRLEAALRRPGERPEPHASRSVAIDPMDRVGAPPVAPAAPREAANGSRSASAKPAFDNLEDEMASLLGRPKTPS